jgi:glycosyltransferase involved in cell wall biosynthesis
MHNPQVTPRVSIGMPVYNGASFLREAITSLLEQDYTDFELIVADNASTDRTEAIVHSFLKDPRIRYFRHPRNIGAAPNFNYVFSLARGEYFKWAAADDVHYPENLRRTVAVLSAAPPEVVLVAPRVDLIDEDGKSLLDENGIPIASLGLGKGQGPERFSTCAKTPSRRLSEVLPRLKWASPQFGLFRTEALRKTRLFDSFYGSDLVLLAEVALLGEILEIDRILYGYRQHGEKSTNAHKNRKDYLRWLNPTSKDKNRRIMSIEYARSIARLPLSFLQRGLCLSVVARVWAQQKLTKINPHYAR